MVDVHVLFLTAMFFRPIIPTSEHIYTIYYSPTLLLNLECVGLILVVPVLAAIFDSPPILTLTPVPMYCLSSKMSSELKDLGSIRVDIGIVTIHILEDEVYKLILKVDRSMVWPTYVCLN